MVRVQHLLHGQISGVDREHVFGNSNHSTFIEFLSRSCWIVDLQGAYRGTWYIRLACQERKGDRSTPMSHGAARNPGSQSVLTYYASRDRINIHTEVVLTSSRVKI